MFGIDEFYEGMLLEARSSEEIKRIYEYQFVNGKGVPQEVLDEVFDMDPTRKKTFTKWLLLKWPEESNLIRNCLSNGKIRDIFRYFQERSGSGLSLADVKSVSDALRLLPNTDPIFAPVSEDEKSNPENDFKIVYDSPEWRVVRPFTYEADKKLGQGSSWCTAGAYGDGSRYWDDYTEDGPIWVNFDLRKSEIAPGNNKEYPYKRYQFCFESNDFMGELCDIDDNRVNFSKIDIPDAVVDFYGSIDERYKLCIETNGDNTKIIAAYNEWRKGYGHVIKTFKEYQLLILPAWDDTMDMSNEPDAYGIFASNDLKDSFVDAEFTSPSDIKIIDACDGYPCIVIGWDGRWGKETKVMYCHDDIWMSYNLSDYGKTDNAYYFLVESSVSYEPVVFAFFKGQEYQNGRVVLEDSYKVISLDFKIPGFENGLWLQILKEDGDSSLMYLPKNRAEEKRMFIMADYPYVGDKFKISKIGDMYVVQGRRRSYTIAGGNSSDMERSDFIKQTPLSEYPGLMIVAYEIRGRRIMGLIEEESGKFLIDNVSWIEDYGKILKIKTGTGQEFLFNPKTQAQSRPAVIYGNLSDSLFAAYTSDEDDFSKYVIKDTGDDFKEYGPFEKIFQLVNDNMVLVSKKGDAVGDIHSYDLTTGKYGLPDGIKNIGSFSNLNRPIVLVQDSQRNISVMNCETNKILANNLNGSSRPTWLTVVQGEVFWRYEQRDGKYNVFSDKRGTLFQGGLDELENRSIDKRLLIAANNGKRFFIELGPSNYKVLPTDNGIDVNQISQFEISNMTHKAEIRTKDASIAFEYDPVLNKVTRVSPSTPETVQIANKIMFPERAQISEEFNQFYSRIKRDFE